MKANCDGRTVFFFVLQKGPNDDISIFVMVNVWVAFAVGNKNKIYKSIAGILNFQRTFFYFFAYVFVLFLNLLSEIEFKHKCNRFIHFFFFLFLFFDETKSVFFTWMTGIHHIVHSNITKHFRIVSSRGNLNPLLAIVVVEWIINVCIRSKARA